MEGHQTGSTKEHGSRQGGGRWSPSGQLQAPAPPTSGIRKPGARTANQRGCHPENKFHLPAESKFEQKTGSPKQIRNVCRQALQGKLSEASLVSSSLPIIIRSLSCRHSIIELKSNLGSPRSGDIELKNVDDDTFFKLIMSRETVTYSSWKGWISTSSVLTRCSLANAPVKNIFAKLALNQLRCGDGSTGVGRELAVLPSHMSRLNFWGGGRACWGEPASWYTEHVGS